MTLAEKIAKVKESELSKLEFEGQVLGLRVKFFDVNTEQFLYYDFELDVVRGNKNVVKFVNSLKLVMQSIQLHRDGKGLLLSDDEIKGGVVVQEFKDEADAVQVLEKLRHVYEARG